MSETVSKRIYYLSAIAIVALVLIGVFAVARPITVQTHSSSSTKTLQVNGVGTISATPDEVLLYLAVETQSATATQATQDNAAVMTKVFQALISAGVSRDSISTISYSLTPTYNNSNNPDTTNPPKVIGYIARNSIQVTLANVSRTGVVLDTAVAAGANEVGGITFTFTSQTYAALQKQALQVAIQDAAGQAQSMATTLGVHIVAPISVTTGYYYQPSAERMTTADAQTPIQTGTLQVTASVQITYEISST
jgi:uncharacterized protein